MCNRINKRILITCFICIAVVLLPFYSYGKVLFGREYYEELRKHIAQAEESIVVAMYFIIMEEESPVNILVDDLIAANKRGVDVKVVVEDAKLGESLPAYNKLKENGIDVNTDMPGKRLHVKGVVIDGRYVFLGSANWSKSAIEDNYEATVFMDSKSDAADLLKFIENATIKKETPIKYEGVAVPASFLLSPKKGRVLFVRRAHKQFDLYLLLLREYAETGKTTFEIDEKALVEEMGYKLPEDLKSYEYKRTFYRATIDNFLMGLKEYGFIDYKGSIVTLKLDEDEGSTENYSFTIPYKYWEYDYDQALSMRAKYMYLVCLYEAPRSVDYPYWTHSQRDMAKLYGISRPAVTEGLRGLEDIGILEVTRSKPHPPDFSARKVNVYKLLPLRPLNQ